MTRKNDTDDDGSNVVNDTDADAVSRRGALRAGAGLAVTAVGGASVAGTAAAQSALDGSGTESDPYLIDTASDLDAVRDDLAAHYNLTSDIDATSIDNWDPIGTYDESAGTYTGFTGTLAGDGHVIDGLTIDRPGASGVGLVAYADGATITDLTVTGATVTGLDYAGVIAGDTWEATVSNVTVRDATVAGRDRVGGVVGEADATTIDTVCVTGEVLGAATNSGNHGGVTGYLTTPSSITDASVTVTIAAGTGDAPGSAGGVAGTAAGHINTVRADVDITADGDAGGIAGVVNAGSSTGDAGVIEYASARGVVTNTAGTATGGVTGRADDANAASTIRDVYSHVTVSNTSGSELAQTAGIVAHPSGGTVIERAYHAAGTVSAADGAVGGAIADTSVGATVSSVYVETGSVDGTAVDDGASGVTRVTTSSMTGSDAESSMGALDFDATWVAGATGEYPTLASTPSMSCGAVDGSWTDTDDGVVAGGVSSSTRSPERYLPWGLAAAVAAVAAVRNGGDE